MFILSYETLHLILFESYEVTRLHLHTKSFRDCVSFHEDYGNYEVTNFDCDSVSFSFLFLKLPRLVFRFSKEIAKLRDISFDRAFYFYFYENFLFHLPQITRFKRNPCYHKTVFVRQFDVLRTSWTPNGRQNNIMRLYWDVS